MVILSEWSRCRSIATRWIGAFAFALLVALACLGAVSARTELQVPEYRVKAAFVYKFGDYVEWPPAAFANPDSPLVIGVVGAGALADELARISAGRTIGGRPVAVRKLRYGEPLSGLHVIFLGRSTSKQLAAALEASNGRAVLTITESEDGFRLGSMINFVVVADKVRFDVALARAEASQLKVSSRLLEVARNIVAPAP